MAICVMCGNDYDGHFFCCAHCAREKGYEVLRDRAGS